MRMLMEVERIQKGVIIKSLLEAIIAIIVAHLVANLRPYLSLRVVTHIIEIALQLEMQEQHRLGEGNQVMEAT